MNLIYSCLFFQDDYINLLHLLLMSYKLYGNSNAHYLIICDPKFKEKVEHLYSHYKIEGDIWSIEPEYKISPNIAEQRLALFESSYYRLNIFKYKNIHLYEKILYLDCDILITNNLQPVFNIAVEDKLYTLKEECGREQHCHLYTDEEYEKLDKSLIFSAGILLFNNTPTMKSFCELTLNDIAEHIKNMKIIPHCLDQPFIIYNSFKLGLSDNTILLNYAKNILNPDPFTGQSICHFPTNPGDYKNKVERMTYYLNDIRMAYKK